MPDPVEMAELLAEAAAEVADAAGAESAAYIDPDLIVEPPAELEPEEVEEAEEVPPAAKTPEEIATAAAAAEAGKTPEVLAAEAAALAAAAEPPVVAGDSGYTLAETVVDTRPAAALKVKEDALVAQLDALDAKLDDGDLTQAEYNAQSRKINRELTDVTGDRKAEERSNADAAKVNAREWDKAQSAFFKANPTFAADKNEILYNALDAQVRKVTADPKNIGLTLAQSLELAKTELQTALGIVPKKIPDQKKVPDPANRKKPEIPPSMDDLSNGADVAPGDEFDHIDRLKGSARSQAVRNLTDEQRKRYEGH